MTGQFRKYTAREKEFYRLQHANQTLDFAKDQKIKHLQFDKGKLTVSELVCALNTVVDESDPDNEHTSSVMTQELHNLQTAAAVEKAGHPDWMVLVAFVHDGGKILALPQYGNLPQWSVVGDTFVLGAPFPSDPSLIVFPEFFKDNVDYQNPSYQSRSNEVSGIYKKGVGLENVVMSFGHDEYFYRVIENHYKTNQIPFNEQIPPQGLAMIRFHSFYPWHTGDGKGRRAYTELESNNDKNMLPWVKEFQSFDLYSKAGLEFNRAALEKRLGELANRYLPGKIAL